MKLGKKDKEFLELLYKQGYKYIKHDFFWGAMFSKDKTFDKGISFLHVPPKLSLKLQNGEEYSIEELLDNVD